MSEKNKGGVTRRGLLWAGELAAVPLLPAQAFDHRGGGMPWEGVHENPRAVEQNRPIKDLKAGKLRRNK